jgi:VWFA-related protein
MCRFARRYFWILLVCAHTGLGQISVPALVTDPTGKGIHGLQKSDFAVSSGKAAAFDSVEEVPALSFSGFGDPTPVFILFDALSVPPPMQNETAKQLLQYLRIAADQHFAVTLLVNSDRGLEVIHDMSTDSRVFVAAMDRVLPEAGGQKPDSATATQSDEFSKAVAQEVSQLQGLNKVMPYAAYYKAKLGEDMPFEDQARQTLETQELASLQQIGQTFRRSRKRKLLIWLTGYFPLSVANGELTYGNFSLPFGQTRSSIRPEMTGLYQAAMDSLNDSRISVYPAFVVDERNFDVQRNAKDSLDGLDGVARRTGGRMLGIFDTLDFPSTVSGLRKNFDSYYIFTFTLQSARKSSWIDSNIKLVKADAKVTGSSGFFADK